MRRPNKHTAQGITSFSRAFATEKTILLAIRKRCRKWKNRQIYLFITKMTCKNMPIRKLG